MRTTHSAVSRWSSHESTLTVALIKEGLVSASCFRLGVRDLENILGATDARHKCHLREATYPVTGAFHRPGPTCVARVGLNWLSAS